MPNRIPYVLGPIDLRAKGSLAIEACIELRVLELGIQYDSSKKLIKKGAMKAIVIECPICGKRVSLKAKAKSKAANNHRRRFHPDIELTEYISLIAEAKSNKRLRFKQYKVPRVPRTPVSATTVLQQARNASEGVRSIVSAGAFGMRKG